MFCLHIVFSVVNIYTQKLVIVKVYFSEHVHFVVWLKSFTIEKENYMVLVHVQYMVLVHVQCARDRHIMVTKEVR